MLLVGLLVCVGVYPFLHELGHVIASWCVGADVQRVTLFPVPSVLCAVGDVADWCVVMIGVGGMIFPAIIALLIPQKRFAFWFGRMLLQGISAMAFAVSIFSIVMHKNPQDDMVQALAYWQYGTGILVFALCAILVLIIFTIIRERPVRRLCAFFGV